MPLASALATVSLISVESPTMKIEVPLSNCSIPFVRDSHDSTKSGHFNSISYFFRLITSWSSSIYLIRKYYGVTIHKVFIKKDVLNFQQLHCLPTI